MKTKEAESNHMSVDSTKAHVCNTPTLTHTRIDTHTHTHETCNIKKYSELIKEGGITLYFESIGLAPIEI